MAAAHRRRSSRRAAPKRGPRASWKGNLRFGLVSFSVQAFNAHIQGEGAVAFHQLHADCGRRIRYEKHCPVHGAVSNDEIVTAHEYAKGKYVEVDDAELDAMRTDAEKALTLDSFIARWSKSAAEERANKDHFVLDLCEALDVPKPEPTTQTSTGASGAN